MYVWFAHKNIPSLSHLSFFPPYLLPVPPSRTLNRQIAIIAGVDGAEEQLGKVSICVFVSICVCGGEEAGENGRETGREKERDRESKRDSE